MDIFGLQAFGKRCPGALLDSLFSFPYTIKVVEATPIAWWFEGISKPPACV